MKKGLEVEVYDSGNPRVDEGMKIYRELHEIAAGSVTRAKKSFDQMFRMLNINKADLFICRIGNQPVSVLLCGKFRDTTFGWSQANHPEYEKEYSPRHYLEWYAILHYRRHNFKMYDLGTRYYSAQISDSVSEKMVTISDFKERYGGKLLPYIEFEAFLDENIAIKIYKERVAEYIESSVHGYQV